MVATSAYANIAAQKNGASQARRAAMLQPAGNFHVNGIPPRRSTKQ
jgi:hypothetical protein